MGKTSKKKIFLWWLTLGLYFEQGRNRETQPFPLDMAPTSIDDQYAGCSNNMHNEVNTVYLPREKMNNSEFNNAWNEASKKAKPSRDELKKKHSMAIYVCTNAEPEIYPHFNRQVRDGRCNYGTTFQYHSLHFYLTEAIQKLKLNQRACRTTYRRTNVHFVKDVVNLMIRFGTFTSSTLNQTKGRDSFGKTSCFEISTCFGAEISSYSVFPGESEVLINLPMRYSQ
uniref:NAD(P)(+)--arginine ADP-ribosyltransferase n=1 Tax=Hucho hucho TaxID=62062 RepID=A0A4W5QJL8_9TELE